ncbi:MAG: hypothetical protein Q9203_007513 [Teloschistes exilis]
MIRALLLQLSSQLQDDHADLKRLYESYKTGIPPTPVLLVYLQRLIQGFRHVYILLDALDESPRTGPREHILKALGTIREWGLQHLHLFVTSRDDLDIRESLNLPTTHQVIMQNAGINQDITDFVSGQLVGDRRLRKWLSYHDKIQATLTNGAKGVFRWVECQLKSLQTCPRSEDHLDMVLNSLPSSLDETYERMLCNVESYLIEDARRILTLLCFASRPLTVQEVIDGVAVQISGSVGLNRKRRLQDSDDICDICRGLIDIRLGAVQTNDIDHQGYPVPTVRIAHFSVQEYLESGRIRDQKAAIFSLSSTEAHTEIAQICLVYLLENGLSRSSLDQGLVEEFPLAHFAAMYWYRHYRDTENPTPRLESLIANLFDRQQSFATWVRLHDMDRPGGPFINFSRRLDTIATPVYYASLLGLDWVLSKLINREEPAGTTVSVMLDVSSRVISKPTNTEGQRYVDALQAASDGGHDRPVQTLLEKGADVNAQGGYYGNALQAASQRGHEKVVQMLLENGADVNAQGGHYGNALQAASEGGHGQVVQMLLDKGADVNAQGGQYGNALYVASWEGHGQVVQMLLDKGADVKAQGGHYGNALYVASWGGHGQVVQMLLDKGADVNAQGGWYGNALQAASLQGHDRLVQMLLDKGADVNAQGGDYGNALQAASLQGHDQVVQVLLDKGAM